MIRHIIFVAALLAGAPATAQLSGINLSGGEFRGVENGALIPSPADVRAYHDSGFRLFRIPIKQSQISNPKVRAIADTCVSLNVPCIFDFHDYSWPSVEAQTARIVKLSRALPDSDLIQIDPVNEPKGFDDAKLTNNWEQWARDARLITAAVRTQGVKNRLWWEYPQSSGISRFDKSERAGKACESAACGLRRQGNINDPLKRSGMNGHRYFDITGAGTSAYCAKGKNSQFATFARQTATFGMPAIVTEAAFGKTAGCATVKAATLTEMKRGIPNLYGVTWWGGGRGWPKSYLFYTPAALASATLAGR